MSDGFVSPSGRCEITLSCLPVHVTVEILHVHCEVVQLISASSNYSLGDNCLSICSQSDEDLIAEQDSDITTSKYSRMLQ